MSQHPTLSAFRPIAASPHPGRRVLAARAVLTLAVPLLLAACGGGVQVSAAPPSTDRAPLLLGPEDVLVVGAGSGSTGALLSGTLQPRQRADLRAEMAGVVVALTRESGEAVRRGDLLLRLDDTALRDGHLSAQASERAATQAHDQAKRQLERLRTLRESGMASLQTLEDAEARRDAAQSELIAARARVAQARQQWERSEVRAPFDGVVSERRVSLGDTVQPGRELLKVIDPRRLRLEGLMSAEAAATVRPGQTVTYRVSGLGSEPQVGSVRLISPAALAGTRQVEVLVDVAPGLPVQLVGLYAEGRVHTGQAAALALPPTAVVLDPQQAWVWKVDGGRVRKVPVTLGPRDPRQGDHALLAGLVAGDRVLRHPVGALRDGQPVQMPASATAAVAASS